MTNKILITSALPYVNNVPHLGNIIGCVLPADVLARYYRQKDDTDVLYICGTDGYGTCTEMKAREEGIAPRELCDKYFPLHKEIYEWFGINFDYFGRTSTPDPRADATHIHTQIAQDIFIKLANNGFLIEMEITQLYCNELSMFVSDRYVVGECVHCGYDRANGDQCDGCGRLLDANALINPVYKPNPAYKLVGQQTEHLFLNLPALIEQLTEWYAIVRDGWSKVATDVTNGWYDIGLEPRCITRDIKWGTPIPDTDAFGDKYRNKVMYNWFDAPIGYISITATHTRVWKEWWRNDNVRLIQFLGVDNVLFHSIIFPASLLGTISDENSDNKYTLVKNLNASRYLNYNGGKFSKSGKVGIFGDDAMSSGIPADVWRFYLLYRRPETCDTEFTWEDFQTNINNILIASFGNFVNRVLTLTYRTFDHFTPPLILNKFREIDQQYIDYTNEKLSTYRNLMEHEKLHKALDTLIDITREGNRYLVACVPWKLWNPYPKRGRAVINVSRDRAGSILNVALHVVATLGNVIIPFLPMIGNKILTYIGGEYHYNEVKLNILNSELVSPEILVSPLTNALITKLKNKYN